MVRFKPNPTARLRLFCFPYAGGGTAVYRPWVDSLPSTVELCAIKLPGREDRLREAPFQRLSELIPVAVQAVSPYLDIPYAFFGHSMGSLICFELARELRRVNQSGPAHIFVSALRAPQRWIPTPFTHKLPDAAFVEEVGRRWGGIPEAALREPELLELLLPTLRADLTVVETYTYTSGTPLNCSISCFGGEDDQTVGEEDLAAWREQTRGGFTLTMFAGTHFFIRSAHKAVLRTIAQRLSLTVS